jgi:hypothetical protein
LEFGGAALKRVLVLMHVPVNLLTIRATVIHQPWKKKKEPSV